MQVCRRSFLPGPGQGDGGSQEGGVSVQTPITSMCNPLLQWLPTGQAR